MLEIGEFVVAGYVHDYLERRADRLTSSMGNFGQQALEKILGERKSQLTVVTSDLKSFTMFADLRNVIVGRKDSVIARLRAVRTALPGGDSIFLASDLMV